MVTTVAEAEATLSSSLNMDVVELVARTEPSPSSLSLDGLGAGETVVATLYDADDNEMRPPRWGWYSANGSACVDAVDEKLLPTRAG